MALKIESMYLATWFPRTTLHLDEVENFLQDTSTANPGERQQRESLKISRVSRFELYRIDVVRAHLGELIFTMAEDGIITLQATGSDTQTLRSSLEHAFEKNLGPALSRLFQYGAPIPKQLHTVEEHYPLYLITSGATPPEVENMMGQTQGKITRSVSAPHLEIHFGDAITIINLHAPDDYPWEDLLQNIVFLREFRLQLHNYIRLHRVLWEELSTIREARHLRFRDFPGIRANIMEYIKTLRFVSARLHQMGDICRARYELLDPDVKAELSALSLLRFENFIADQRYILDLLNMTTKYGEGTLVLLESLFQENTQRELNALKVVTFIAAVTGFFGMNVAFPWEERWATAAGSTYAVILFTVAAVFAFYVLLRILIYNRHFTTQKSK